MIQITHTHEEGTLVDGTRKGDGVYEILRQREHGFRYFPSIGAIGIQGSRDRAAQRSRIIRATEALRAAGYDVADPQIDDTPRAYDEVKADRADRLEDRRERLTARAERGSGRL